MEVSISEAYLATAVRGLHALLLFSTMHAPLLTVNTEHLDPAHSDEDFDLLLDRIRADARSSRVLQPRE